MKKLILFTALIFFIFTGCKKEEVSAKISASIIGKWYATKTVTTKYTTTTPTITTNNISIRNDYDQFNNNGTGESKRGGSTYGFTYQYNNPSLIVTFNPPSSAIIKYEVKEITSNNLYLVQTTKDSGGNTTEIYEVYLTNQ